jgi:integrase/recombinase XerD
MAKQKDAHIYQRGQGGIWWVRFTLGGHEIRESLRTRNRQVAQRAANELKEAAQSRFHRGETTKSWHDVIIAWSGDDQADGLSDASRRRYACSFAQLQVDFGHMLIHEISKKEINDYVLRRKKLVSIATVKRDLVALSQILGYADDQNWREGNPARDKMTRMKERRDPIVLPPPEDIEAVLASCSPSMALLARAALLTGARQKELCHSIWSHLRDKDLTLIGKRNKRRVIQLTPEALALFQSCPRHATSTVVFHHDGEAWVNPSSYFASVVARVQKSAQKAGQPFTRFRFHDLRHVYAVRFLQNSGNIYTLQKELGHTSVKTTEMYLEYLTPEQVLSAKAESAQKSAQEQRSSG